MTTVFFFSCQADEEMSVKGGVGYLRLNVGMDNSTNTRAAEYNPKQIAVQIVDKEGKVVKETDDWTSWGGEPVEIKAGTYTVKASSAGFDNESGFDKPYYAGSKTVTVEEQKEANAEVVCSLANVKVTVKFDEKFKAAFKTIVVQVADKAGKNQPLSFTTSETRSAYFPVAQLVSTVTVTNKNGVPKTQTNDLPADVKARDHFILTYKIAEKGSGNISISVDPTTKEYNFTINVGEWKEVNAWTNRAYLEEEISEELSNPKFQYRKADAEDWTDIEGEIVREEGKYKITLEDLTANTAYQYRLMADGFEGAPVDFTTEEAVALQNAGFEDWYQAGNIWYAASQADYDGGTYLWDTSNPGGGTFGFNPTTADSEIKKSGTSSAKLETQYAFIKLAAASLYYGRFVELVGIKGAKINFGQPFTSRPIALHGFYQYKPEVIDEDKKEVGSSGVLKKGDTDVCAIYIALAKKQYEVDNTDPKTFIKFETDDNIIAYGELPAKDCVNTNSEWKEFNIALKYKEKLFGEKPTHLIIVCSSSKYGDYFTGAIGSTLHVDDFSLIYDGEPEMWK